MSGTAIRTYGTPSTSTVGKLSCEAALLRRHGGCDDD
jgi:hypothetical protein